jgi:hypothetical protein
MRCLIGDDLAFLVISLLAHREPSRLTDANRLKGEGVAGMRAHKLRPRGANT